MIFIGTIEQKEEQEIQEMLKSTQNNQLILYQEQASVYNGIFI